MAGSALLLILRGISVQFSSWLGQFTLKPTVHECLLYSLSWCTLVVSFLINKSCSNSCEAVPLSGLICSESFSVCSYLHVFLGQMSFQDLCPFFNLACLHYYYWFVCALCIFWILTLFRFMTCKYFVSFHRLSLFMKFLCYPEAFSLM